MRQRFPIPVLILAAAMLCRPLTAHAQVPVAADSTPPTSLENIRKGLEREPALMLFPQGLPNFTVIVTEAPPFNPDFKLERDLELPPAPYGRAMYEQMQMMSPTGAPPSAAMDMSFVGRALGRLFKGSPRAAESKARETVRRAMQ